jgi:toxin ParE1/3/4
VKRAIVHPEADAELLEAMDWYDAKRFGLGLELMEEVRRAIERLESDPALGVRYGRSQVRYYRVSRFPYVIYYQELSDRLSIAAIAHARRRPGYWKKRKPHQS